MLAFFDPVSGVSGDMALGALLDAGLPLAALEAELARLHVPGFRLDASRAEQHGLTGTRVRVLLDDTPQPERHLRDIAAILDGSTLAPAVRERALAVFQRLAVAEARVHGTTPDQVHFHEVGALDSIVDIVGVVAGLALLGVDECYCGPLPLPLRGGIGRSAHGPIPLPGPATLEILSAVNAPFISRDTDRELVTPTGAALVAELCRFEQPPLRLQRVGVGFGQRTLPWPNVLRLLLCESVAAPSPAAGLEQDRVVLLETNIDDMNPQIYGYLLDRLLGAGALDAWLTPIQMKKGRPATLVSVLTPPAAADALSALLLRETSTLGVRRRELDRLKAPRRMLTVVTSAGPIRVKARLLDGAWTAQPEYDDCLAAAQRTGRPLREILDEAATEARRLLSADAQA
ncbi:MAG TPA: nickel pincer cofactor biosynthesis protein LarC [Chloroflexia bacterium]